MGAWGELLTTEPHLSRPTPILKGQQAYIFLNIAKELRDLSAFVKHKRSSWVGPCPEITISTTRGPNLALSDLELALPAFVSL